ncbi:MAG TPA: SUMF1/EgtB/PvdO family nonheme iron enzyme [Thermoguttaceae bacterium]|nr:SUMF1/EgtB/PvdO family nonheme iron enzyme [Thermoguttaceae bacterium]
MRLRCLRLTCTALSLVLCLVATLTATGVAAADSGVALLVSATSPDQLGPESQAAWALAKEVASAVLILPGQDGTFVDASGQPVSLDRFRVVWHHQGDSADQTTALDDPRSLQALKKHASDGHALFLSGAALAMVHSMEIEAAKPRLGGPGKDDYVAKLIPEQAGHPIFDGLRAEGIDLPPSVGGNPRELSVAINDGGFSAYSDFHGSGGPRSGMLLARAAAGAENPLVEYEVGKGRVIVLGWRLPHYSHADNAHRANLERLTGNILTYLGDAAKWQQVVVGAFSTAGQASSGTPTPSPEPGVPSDRWRALRTAVVDLIETFQDRYPDGAQYLSRLDALKRSQDALSDEAGEPDQEKQSKRNALAAEFAALKQEALLANPLLDFDRLLLVERGEGKLGLPANWQSNSSLPAAGYDNRLAVLSPVRPDGELTTLYRPDGGRFLGDVELHYDADRMLFSMPGSNGRWRVFEMSIDGSDLRELPLINEPDVDNYDACYLPDGRIVFASTAAYVGVPCVYGSSYAANLYQLERDGSIRQLTVDQEDNWCPVVTNGGRVMYLRWEYTDLPHSNSRILFHMNPDGTGQMEYYGSNSFFTNSFFYARPIPGRPTKVVGIATGHHGVARSGRLLILDPALGRHEADGVVQEIPGWGKKVEPIILDPLADGAWPQFLHPFPLSEKYFLVSAKPTPASRWGIYLVDVFDNMTLIKKTEGYALLEPVPVQKRPVPPVIEDRIDPERRDALVYLSDIYVGGGLQGIPRGTVKNLRLLSYHFSYRGMGGLLGSIGMDGPWDIKRVLGTVPVESDGSALFRVPAYTPVAVQPLDENGQALQIMRSWFTAMPGEVLSCVGCHEKQNTGTPNQRTLAARGQPAEIAPWYGPVRGFNFAREVQPVLDKHCVVCHDGRPRDDAPGLADLRGAEMIADWNSGIAGHVNPKFGGKFSASYAELHRYVRRPGIESNIRLQTPMEFHASTTELGQILSKGHYGVRLEPEAWDRLSTWIDLNAPYHGTWTEIAGKEAVEPPAARARELKKRYTGVDEDPEAIPEPAKYDTRPVTPEPLAEPPAAFVACRGWPFDAQEARRRQAEAGPVEETIDLGEGVALALVRIPAGEFVMGDAGGHPDERPLCAVKIETPFWMGRFEVSNAEFARFDPGHDSGVEPMHGYQFGIHGYPMNGPKQPAVRLSWDEAMAFCDWLSARSGRHFTLPTEAQWEHACRAGTATPMWYGDLDADFSSFANLGDAKLREFALDTYIRVHLVPDPNKYDDWVPKDDRFNDGGFVSANVGSYQPNPWGLCDVHGNVWEWTRSTMRPYPYREDDGRNDPAAPGKRVVRGGSWYDRPTRCRSAFRLAYEPYQRVFNVGFRVVMEAE